MYALIAPSSSSDEQAIGRSPALAPGPCPPPSAKLQSADFPTSNFLEARQSVALRKQGPRHRVGVRCPGPSREASLLNPSPPPSYISGLCCIHQLRSIFFLMHDKDPQVAMASAEPCKDLEPGLPSRRVIDEKGPRGLYQNHGASPHPFNSSRRSAPVLLTRDKMPSFRRLTLTLLVVAFLTVAYASVPVYRRSQDSPNGAKDTSFQDLLNSVSDASLHDVLLNLYDKYRHGVFPEDRTAMQAVHDDNAAVATSLVELARRQKPNVTSVTIPPSSTATVVVVPTTEIETVTQTSGSDTLVIVGTQTTVAPVTPTSPTGTPVQTTAPQVSSNPPSGSSSSVPVPVQSSVSIQSVNSSPLPGSSGPTSVSPSPSSQANATSQSNPTSSQASAQSSPNGGGGTTTPSPSATTFIKSSSTTFASTSPGRAGASTSAGAGAVTTRSSSTQQILFTTTLPNGGASTVTSYTVVPAGEQASTPGVSGSTTTGTPSLQNGAVEGTQPRGMGLVGPLAAALIFVIGIL